MWGRSGAAAGGGSHEKGGVAGGRIWGLSPCVWDGIVGESGCEGVRKRVTEGVKRGIMRERSEEMRDRK